MARTAPDKSPLDPRLRPFRVAAYAFYLVVVSVFCLFIIFSVFRSVYAMSPSRKPSSAETLTVRECLDGAEALWRELDDHRRELSTRAPARRADQEWTGFRVGWLNRLRELESRCAVESQGRAPIRVVFERLDGLMDLYTTHAVQFAGAVGGPVDAFRESLQEARRDPAAGRFP
ncbi:MAG TPA: hypothetical protein VK447_15040 [Myxococcaceae bacterium]|nr:hypothetical protein [Myxococcaceae bacterium]